MRVQKYFPGFPIVFLLVLQQETLILIYHQALNFKDISNIAKLNKLIV